MWGRVRRWKSHVPCVSRGTLQHALRLCCFPVPLHSPLSGPHMLLCCRAARVTASMSVSRLALAARAPRRLAASAAASDQVVLAGPPGGGKACQEGEEAVGGGGGGSSGCKEQTTRV